jgi:hypothetical protein
MQLSLTQASSMHKQLVELTTVSFEDPVVGRRLMRNLDKLQPEITVLEKARMQLVNKHAVKNEDGTPKAGEEPGTIMLVNSQAYLQDLAKLLEDTIEIDLQTIFESRLPKGLTGAQLHALLPIIVDDPVQAA